MRRLVLPLVIVLSGCAAGTGITPGEPDTTTSTAPPVTVVVDEATRSAATEVAVDFYNAVLTGDGRAIASLGTDPPATLQDELDAWAGSIGLQGGSFVVLKSDFTDTTATVTVRLSLDLVEVGPWSYETSVTLVGGPDWTTLWAPSALYPTLESGDVLRVDRSWLPRASILAADGTPLAGAEPVKIVGVVPSRIEDLDSLKLTLAGLAGIDPAVVDAELANPAVQPDWFVPVGSMKLVVYDTVGAEIESVPGVVLRDGSARLPYRDGFASHLIGTVGPITAEQLEDLGFPYGPTDTVGQTGLERRYEDQLAGRPLTTIVRVNKFGRILEEVFSIEAGEPEDITTTIDVEVQTAVEFALRDVTRPAAIVVVQASTGEIRGVVSQPAEEFDRAVLGLYPPGSTFKVVTATSLLTAGSAPTDEVECPSAINLGGRTLTNAGDFELGTTTLRTAFAASCNTTFASLATQLPSGALVDTARLFGFDTEPDLGVPAAASLFPVPVDTAELAAAAIGQGRVEASPVHMASVAAAASTGVWRPPTVLSVATRSEGIPLDPTAIQALQTMTRAVVTDGTGTAAAVDGVDVRGKTGSAEFTTTASSPTHAWFIGYWDDYAIAVLVERGGGGGAVAAPLARRVIGDLAN